MGFFSKAISKLSGALAKTKETFVSGLKSLILGRKLDEALIDDVQRMLLEADVGQAATSKLIESARADFRAGKLKESAELLEHLKRGLKEMLGGLGGGGGRGLELTTAPARPTVYLITGINGAGKTTSIAKLARHLREDGKTVLLGACDTFRAGAVKQLEVWGERLGVTVVKGAEGADPAAVAFDACRAAVARGVDVLIIDTAGRLQTQDPLMRQLGKIKGVIAKALPGSGAPHETLLVLDATTGQNALRQAEAFGRATGGGEQPSGGITGIILAKLDGTAKGGVVVAIRSATDIPVKFIGTGERPEDLAPFDPDAFVEAMFSA